MPRKFKSDWVDVYKRQAPAFETKFQVIAGPLMSEYLLYFTIHETVQIEPIPLAYEPIALPKSWQELTSAEEY